MDGHTMAVADYVVNNLTFPVIMCGYLIWKNNKIEAKNAELMKEMTQAITNLTKSMDKNTTITESLGSMLRGR